MRLLKAVWLSARPGGLLGAAPSAAVGRRIIDTKCLPDAIVRYTDVTIAQPIISTYALAVYSFGIIDGSAYRVGNLLLISFLNALG
jgi:hypothetical protein